MKYPFEALNPATWHPQRLAFEGRLDPVLDRVLNGPVNDEYAALDCTRVLLGLMEHKRRIEKSTVGPSELQVATDSIKLFLASGNADHLQGLRLTANSATRLGDITLQQRGNSTLFNAIQLGSCLQTADDVERRAGNQDSLMIAVGGSGILPAIQTAICRESLTGHRTNVYPVRFSSSYQNDKAPFVTHDEVKHLRRHGADKAIIVFDEAIGWGTTMAGMMTFADTELGRADAMPVWWCDARGVGDQLWPYHHQEPLGYNKD